MRKNRHGFKSKTSTTITVREKEAMREAVLEFQEGVNRVHEKWGRAKFIHIEYKKESNYEDGTSENVS